MRKYILGFILLLFSLLSNAQEKSDSISMQQRAQINKESKPIMKIIQKLINFSNQDTSYVSPNRYNYTLMSTHFTNLEYYSIGSSLPKEQELSLSPNPLYKIGFYFGWRWIFLGWSFDVDDIFRHTNQKNKGTEFDLSLYSSKVGLDVFYRRTGNNYKIHRLKGFSEKIQPGYSVEFDGLKVNIKGLNAYYIFNNRRFSYPAAFSQSTNQRISTGSLIGGLSFSKHKLEFDFTRLPETIANEMNLGMKMKTIKYTNANISLGYAYNWVFARNCLACLSLTPAISYKSSYVDAEQQEGEKHYNNFDLDFLVRAGIVYNNGKYYVGSSFVGRNFGYHRHNFSLNNGYGTLQIYAGFNFNLKKEYREKGKKYPFFY